MNDVDPLLFEVWRQACRQLHLAQTAPAIADVLRRRIPLDSLVILERDPEHGLLRTAACVGLLAAADAPEPPTAQALDAGRRWCLSGSLWRGPAETLGQRLPWLVLPQAPGDRIAGALSLDSEPLGALVLGSEHMDVFRPTHERLVQAILEPVAVALRNDRQLRELTRLREAAEADRRSLLARLGRQDISDTLIGAGTGLKAIMQGVEQVAPADVPVLILGETGSGKEVIARAVHARSRRARGPFLRVNCGAIPPDLADSELFGHERGSFTGAVTRRLGWFERADGGTLFLDEIGELSPAVQVRLLRILQDGTFERVGGHESLRADVRLIAATHRDLHAMTRDGRFREDLWYRINVFPLRLPALRERPGDIPSMATHFALKAAERLGLTPQPPSPQDMTRLIDYPWPGNVRELAAVIERAAILGEGRTLAVARALGAHPVVPSAAPSPASPLQAPRAMDSLEAVNRRHIEQALERSFGRIAGPFGAARILGINPETLRSRMRKLGIDWRRYRTIDASSRITDDA